MTGLPRYVSTPLEAAARIAGYVFGDGNPPATHTGISGPAFMALAAESFTLGECERCAGVIGWTQGVQWKEEKGQKYPLNFVVQEAALLAALGAPASLDLYHRAMEPTGGWTPTRQQVEAFLASVYEGEGTKNSSPSIIMDESRGGTYMQRLDGCVNMMNTQGLGAVRTGGTNSGQVQAPQVAINAFPVPLISQARYPGSTLADWPDVVVPPPPPPPPPPPSAAPHIMIIAMENRGYDNSVGQTHYVVGSSEFPKVNALLAVYGRLSNCWATYGPNTPNGGPAGVDGSHPMYVALAAGSNLGITSDTVSANPGTGLTNTQLLDQLDAAAIPWAFYGEDLPTDLTSIQNEADGNTYMARHTIIGDFAKFNVSPHLANIKDAGSTVGFGSGTPSWPTLINDLNSSSPPAFVWFSPTAWNQGHGGGPTTGPWAGAQYTNPDLFLDKIIADVKATQWYADGGNIVVWWDEGDNHTSSIVQSGGGQKTVFVVSAKAASRSSRTVSTACNDFGLLADIEDAYGLTRLNHAADAGSSIGAGALTQLLTLNVADTLAPPTPTGLSAAPDITKISLAWSAVSAADLAGYRLYRDGVQIYQGTVPAFLDSPLTAGIAHSYQVTSYDTSNNESAKSSGVPATALSPSDPPPPPPPDPEPPPDPIPDPGDTAPPDVPQGLSGVPASTTVTLVWLASAAPDTSYYRLFRGNLLIANVVAPSTSFQDTGLEPSTVYTYRVVAVDTSGNASESSPFISVTTLFAVVPPPVIATTPRLLTSVLGCHEQTAAYIASRDGRSLLSLLPITSWSYSRVEDDVSTASVELDLVNSFADCCAVLDGLQRFAFELHIFRNGDLEWCGPIIDILPSGENISLGAEDRMTWTKVRPIWSKLDFPDPGVDISLIFNAVLNNAMGPDNPWPLLGTATATGVRAARTYVPNPPQIAYDAIQELARSGVDFTMFRDQLVAGSFVIPTPPIASLGDRSIVDFPDQSLQGANYANQWFVTGEPGDDTNPGIIATYGGFDPVTGLVVRIAAEDDIKDQTSLNQNAKSRWEISNSRGVGDVTLRLDEDAPMPMGLIVPGAVVNLLITAGCLPIAGQYRLKSMNVTGSNVDGPTESVAITLEPVGTEVVE